MNKHAENLIQIAVNHILPQHYVKQLSDASSEIERLEVELAIWRRMKTDQDCVRVNMLRGEVAMLTEVERFHELQTEIERLRSGLQFIADNYKGTSYGDHALETLNGGKP